MRALSEMDRWLAAIQADNGPDSAHAKVVRNKPSTLQEGCNTRDATPRFIADTRQRDSGQCAQLYAAPASARFEAGGPIAADVIKCSLKPVAMSDYQVTFTAQQQLRLRAIFPAGVCNYAVPGVEQQGLRGTWLSF